MRFRISMAVCGLALAISAKGTQLFTNGDFETNGGAAPPNPPGISSAFTGWLTGGTANSDDDFYADSSVDDMTPLTGNGTVGPNTGNWYAVSDNTGLQEPEEAYIVQSVTIPVGTTDVAFSGDMFVNDIYGDEGSGGEIAIWAAGADPLSASPVYVIQSFVDTGEGFGQANAYVLYSVDITAHVTPGTTYEIGVLEEDAGGTINVGVDSFSLVASTATPEPATLLPTALLGAAIILYSLRRKVRT